MRKLCLSLAIVFITVFSLSSCADAAEGYLETLRVGLSFASTAKSEAGFSSEADINVFDKNTMAMLGTIPAGMSATVRTDGTSLMADGIFTGQDAVVLNSTSPIAYNGTKYRGSFELLVKDGKITVINIVGMEEYLASLLGKEMSSSWPIEALKAQAVCARNYASTIVGKHAAYGFDICSTAECQVYGGMSSESEKTRQAANETQGVVVKYNGKIVPLYYFSCDGGYTENSENVWISAEGYLRGKKDIYEDPASATLYNWTVTMTKEEIESELRKKNIDIGELVDIVVNEVSENNGVLSITFVGTKDSKTVTKTQTRTVLSLNSQAYTIEKLEGTIVNAESVTLSDIVPEAKFVLTGEGLQQTNGEVYRITENGIEKITFEEEPEAEGGTTAMYQTYIFNGHGWGHLVGMSQWGAYSMAQKGMSYQDILNFYFTDIEITQG